jgi:hypothetical protein
MAQTSLFLMKRISLKLVIKEKYFRQDKKEVILKALTIEQFSQVDGVWVIIISKDRTLF